MCRSVTVVCCCRFSIVPRELEDVILGYFILHDFIQETQRIDTERKQKLIADAEQREKEQREREKRQQEYYKCLMDQRNATSDDECLTSIDVDGYDSDAHNDYY
jgi:hypothetical protein